MRLSEIKGEKAFEVLTELLEPLAEISADKRVTRLLTEKKLMDAVKIILKEHQSSIVAILAALDGENPDGYLEKVTLVTLPARLLELMSDKEFMQLFGVQMTQASET